MAPVVDASSPARATGSTANSTVAITTGTFNPPASVLVATVQANARPTGASAAITTNGTALSWTTVAERSVSDGGGLSGYAGLFVAVLPSSRVGMTVTATVTSVTSPTEINTPSLKLYVVTGANTVTPVGGSTEGSSTTNNLTTTGFTTTGATSLGFAAGCDWNALGVPVSSDCTADTYDSAGASISAISGYKTLGAVGSSATFNLDAGGTLAAAWDWVSAEILSGPEPPPPLAFTPPGLFSGPRSWPQAWVGTGNPSPPTLTWIPSGTSGTAMAPADTGFDGQFLGAGNTNNYDNAHVYGAASVAGKFQTITAVPQATLFWSTKWGTQTQFYVSMYVYLTAYPSVTNRWTNMLMTTGNSVMVAGFDMDTTGHLVQKSDGPGFAGATTANPIPLNQWVRIETDVTVSTTVGAFATRIYYNADSLVADDTIAVTGQNLAANCDAIRTPLDGALQGPLWIAGFKVSAATPPGAFLPSVAAPTVPAYTVSQYGGFH